MKKFFMFVIVIMACIVNANAQYVSNVDKYEIKKYLAQEESNRMKFPEYYKARNDRDLGMALFFGGVGIQVAGGIIGYNAYVEAWSNIKTVPEGTKTPINGGMTAGCVMVVVGSIMEIVGGYKWAKGCIELRDIKLSYYINNNKFVVEF